MIYDSLLSLDLAYKIFRPAFVCSWYLLNTYCVPGLEGCWSYGHEQHRRSPLSRADGSLWRSQLKSMPVFQMQVEGESQLMVLCFVHTSSHVFILYGSYFLGPESSAWWRKDQPAGRHLGAGGMRNPMLDPRPTGQSRHSDEAFRGSLPTWRSEEPGSRQRVCHHDDLGAAPCFSAMCPLERVQSHGLNHFHRFGFLGQVS